MDEQRSVEGRPLEDAELAGRARDGNVEAYEELVTRYQDLGVPRRWLVTRHAGEAEDAVQDGLREGVLTRCRGSGAGAPFRPWLLRIVANEAQQPRRAPPRAAKGWSCARPRPTRGARSRPPRPRRWAARMPSSLTRALERLDAKDRLVIAYRYLFDLSEAETADALGRQARNREVAPFPGPDQTAHGAFAGGARAVTTDRWTSMTQEQLGSALRAAGDQVQWPPTPDLTTAVLAEIRRQGHGPARARQRLGCRSRRRAIVLIAVAFLLLAAVAVAAKLVIDLGAVMVRTAPGAGGGLPTRPPGGADFGTPVTLAEAAGVAGFAPAIPAGLRDPDQVWVDHAPIGFDPTQTQARIVMAWAPSPALNGIPGTPWGAVLMQFEGEVDVAFKVVYEETGTLSHAYVNGRDAYWTHGEHELTLLTSEGYRTFRVTGNVLLWSDGGFTFRLETELPKRAAVAVAEGVRP